MYVFCSDQCVAEFIVHLGNHLLTNAISFLGWLDAWGTGLHGWVILTDDASYKRTIRN